MHKNITAEDLQNIHTKIKQNYNKFQQYLKLSCSGDIWDLVIMARDWSTLKILQLGQSQIDDSGAELLGNLNWPNLQSLSLEWNYITAKGIKKLLKRQFPQLKQLNLYNNKIGNQGAVILTTTQNMPKLEKLDLGSFLSDAESKIESRGLVYVPDMDFVRLRSLQLSSQKIGSRGVQLLSKAQLPLLQNLGLDSCSIGDKGCKYLVKGQWAELNLLSIGGNCINYDGFSQISNSNWPKLQTIKVWRYSENNKPIALLNIVATNWPTKLKLSYKIISYNLEKYIKEDIILNRFSSQQ